MADVGPALEQHGVKVPCFSELEFPGVCATVINTGSSSASDVVPTLYPCYKKMFSVHRSAVYGNISYSYCHNYAAAVQHGIVGYI